MALWADEFEDKVIDVFGFRGERRRPGNPEVDAWVYRDGLLKCGKNISRGDTLTMLGEEEKYRRTCENLREYVSSLPPNFNEFRKL
ncbi:MAG: hypothetical protein ACE5FT_04410 [Candidatus Nanoarchaeia archaeon]